jgi:hypothetical protein
MYMGKRRLMANIIRVWQNKISVNLVRNKVMIKISKLKMETKKSKNLSKK